MTASIADLVSVLAHEAPLWRSLRARNVAVTTDRGGRVACHRPGDIDAQAQRLAEDGAGAETLAELCRVLRDAPPANARVIDVAQAAALMRRQKLPAAEAIARSLVRYQGTDGVRGRVAASGAESPLARLTENGEFSPELCELLCAAFIQQQRAAGVSARSPAAAGAEDDCAVLAEDGRDAFATAQNGGAPRAYAQAAIRGFTRMGCRVVDLGVAPTPLVPVACARRGARFGAVITASHNPADQNGVKFFADGVKLLPDPDDLAVSAYAFLGALEGLPPAHGAGSEWSRDSAEPAGPPRVGAMSHACVGVSSADSAGGDRFAGTSVERRDPAPLLADFFQHALAADDLALLKPVRLLVDAAHGAFAPYAGPLLKHLGLNAAILNEDMTGDNINRDSGVACLEGKERIAARDAPAAIEVVRRVREMSWHRRPACDLASTCGTPVVRDAGQPADAPDTGETPVPPDAAGTPAPAKVASGGRRRNVPPVSPPTVGSPGIPAGADTDGTSAGSALSAASARGVPQASTQPEGRPAAVYGIALDGDGDRGFLLVHDPHADEVRILDGDRMAYLLARAACSAGAAGGKVLAGTVESDLALFQAAETLGLKTEMTPVGDKWLSARKALTDRLLVGEESSGHIVWPVAVPGPDGQPRTIVTGNGLLSALRVVAAIERLRLSPREAAEPYPPGAMRTCYTYFVDRPRFHRGGEAWRKDLELAHAELARLQQAGQLPPARLCEVAFADDPDMLYLRLEDEAGRTLGALFARNSGTENKTAVCARGQAAHAEALAALARAVNAHHIAALKDHRLPEVAAGDALCAALAREGEISLDAARALAQRHGVVGDARLFALLLALAKEGRVTRTPDGVAAPLA